MNEVLENALDTGKIAGAYLIESATGEAARAEADAFLLRLFCRTGEGCGVCGGCLKYLHQNHVDVMRLEPARDKKTIGVQRVRDEVLAWAYIKPYEGGYKAVLIPEAERLTEEAQNALLKALEEPPDRTVFLLGARDGKNLLPTVRSRCIILRASRDGGAEERLMREFSLPTLRARVLLRVCGGDYYLAKQYAQQDYFELREDMILALSRLLFAKSMATSATEKLFLKHEARLLEAARAAVLYLADVLCYKHTRDAALVRNTDKLGEIEKHARCADRALVNASELLSGFLTKCARCAGLNKKLALTGTLFDILEVVI